MLLIGTREAAADCSVRLSFPSRNGQTGIWKRPYIDLHVPEHPYHHLFDSSAPLQQQPTNPPRGDDHLCPIAYLVEQDPHSIVEPHYHRVHQYQVFVSGRGTFGNLPVGSGTVQYAASFATYGPIVAGDEGLSYLTLRTGWDRGAGWMPKARHDIPTDRKPHRFVANWNTDADENGIVRHEADGVGIWVREAAPRQPISCRGEGGCSHRYVIVLSGSCQCGEQALRPDSLAFLSADEPGPVMTAGPDGARLLILQFAPDPAP